MGTLRQENARNLTPRVIGGPGSATGWSVAPCLGGFAAGAPFTGHADFYPAGLPDIHFDTAGGGGFSVACLRGPTYLAAGPTGIFRNEDGGASSVSAATVWSIAAAAQPGFPLLVAESGTNSVTIKLVDEFGTVVWSSRFFSTSTVGMYVAWIPGTTRFAVGDPGAQRVRLYRYEPNTRMVVPEVDLLDPSAANANSNFGLALAFGDVNPAPGPEVIVGDPSQGKVFVYSPSSMTPLLYVLSGPGVGYGNALAVEPGDAGGGLQALWVGAPTLDTLIRYVGDAGEPTSPMVPDASIFGFALAVENASTLVIGAPMWGDGGAVFEASFRDLIDGGALNGQQQACDVTQPCSVTPCGFGRCHGGVLCVDIVPACPIDQCVNQECLLPDPDAGSGDGGAVEVDAGAVDAGTPSDAGGVVVAVDAGARDAGASDGGTNVALPDSVAFIAGCSVGAFSPLLLLALALFRRQWGPK